MIGAAMIRLGNFFNSEIVGREWYGPWAIRFPRHAAFIQDQWERGTGSTPGHGSLGWVAQALPRHPVQLYEAAAIFGVVLVLWIVDRRYGENRPRGLLTGIFCTLYFGARFIVEYFKEYLRFAALTPDGAQLVIRVLPTAGLTMGQQLSLPFIGIGLWFWIRALRTREPAAALSRFDLESGDE
jgi:prolipoprotein diacylglyceryltransferase